MIAHKKLQDIHIKYDKIIPKRKKRTTKPPIGILICGELGSDTIKAVWDSYDDSSEFILTLCSPGGDISVYHALLDFLENARNEERLTTVALGECYSGAPLLIAGGSAGRRVSYKSTLFGLHEPFLVDVPPDPGTQYAILQQLEAIKNQYYGFLSQFTKHKQKWWRERLEGESMWYLTANEAKSVGLIDVIL